MLPDTTTAIDSVYRSDWGRIVAALIRLVGDFDLAEETAQEAFSAAVDQWRALGVPQFPRAWIIQTARHKAIDRLRRRSRSEASLETYGPAWFNRTIEEPDYDTNEIPDDRKTQPQPLAAIPPVGRQLKELAEYIALLIRRYAEPAVAHCNA